MSKRKRIISDYSIFKPDSARRIHLDYPEIAKNPIFRKLSPEQMIFVWYSSCEASPYFDYPDRDRIQKSIEAAFSRPGGSFTIPKKDVEQYLSGKFPPSIQEATLEMLKFRIGPRVRALLLLEKGFSKLEAIFDIDPNDDEVFKGKDGEVDFSKKKSYVDAFKSATEYMPKIIEQMEHRFAVVEVSDNESIEHEGKGFLDDLME